MATKQSNSHSRKFQGFTDERFRERRVLYKAWWNMIRRCTNPSDAGYKDYGARGISVCQRWMNSFDNFYADIEPRPSSRHTLDRINNDGNYEPGNLKWSTRQEQARNRRSNRRVTIDGETKTIAEWSEERLVDYELLWTRITRRGWDPKRAVETPCDTKHRNTLTRR